MPIRKATTLFVVALLGAGVITGSLIRPLSARFDVSSPQVTWGPTSMFFVLALLIGSLAWTTWQSLHKKKQRFTSEHGVKLLALSRASLIVGALFAGMYAGYALSFLPDRDTPLGSDRVWHSAFATGAALLLVVASLLLERACHLPGGEDDDPTTGNGAAAAA